MTVRIGLDFDGVVANTMAFTETLFREQHGVELSQSDFEWDGGRNPPVDTDADIDLRETFADIIGNPAYVAQIPPVEGAADALSRLDSHPDVELVLATHRPAEIHGAIERWLVANDFPTVTTPGDVPDRKVDLSPSLDVLVDDYHGHAAAAAENGALGVHLTAAWESGDATHPDAVTAPAWNTAVEAVLDRVASTPTP